MRQVVVKGYMSGDEMFLALLESTVLYRGYWQRCPFSLGSANAVWCIKIHNNACV